MCVLRANGTLKERVGEIVSVKAITQTSSWFIIKSVGCEKSALLCGKSQAGL